MSIRRFVPLLAIAGALIAWLDGTSVKAGFIHNGLADPTTEGWVFQENPANTATVGGGTDSKSFWQIDATTNSNSFVFYRVDPSSTGFLDVLNDPSGWSFKVTARVFQAADYPGQPFFQFANSPSFMVTDGDLWGINLVQENVAGGTNPAGAYYQDGSLNLVLLQALDITQYHDYELRMNRNGPTAGDDTVSYFIDGGFVTTLDRSDVLNFGALRASFGDTNSFTGGSVTRYNYAEFSSASNLPEAPEPASFVLICMGALGLAGAGWRRRRGAP